MEDPRRAKGSCRFLEGLEGKNENITSHHQHARLRANSYLLRAQTVVYSSLYIIVKSLQSSGLEDSYMPRQPPYTMNLFANIVNAYRNGEDGIPLEFQRIPATNTMQLTAKMATNIEERWCVAAARIWGSK